MEHTVELLTHASQDAQFWEVAFDKGSNNRFASFVARHFLDVGATMKDIMRTGRKGDPPHRQKPFTLKRLPYSGRRLVRVNNYPKTLIRRLPR